MNKNIYEMVVYLMSTTSALQQFFALGPVTVEYDPTRGEVYFTSKVTGSHIVYNYGSNRISATA